jgi:arylsulfotransferase ASST
VSSRGCVGTVGGAGDIGASLRRRLAAPALAAPLIGAALCSSAAAQQPPPVSAYPSPGTLSASPGSQVSFRGRPAGELGAIEVTGSKTGRHAGELRAHPDGQGASFVPRKRFRGGETVTVRTDLAIHNATAGDFRFRIARVPGTVRLSAVPFGPPVRGKRRRFRSRPDLLPPLVKSRLNAGASPGYVVLGPRPRLPGQAGPMIVDGNGETVYFRPLGGRTEVADVRVQRYQGRPVLTWWQGRSRQGIGYGHFVILDETYRVVKRVQAGNGYRGDLHEFLITPRNTAVLINYPVVRVDLSSVGGSPRGRIVDSVIQEIDLETGLVLFEWHSFGNVAIKDSFAPLQPSFRVPYDYFHANSVDVDADGDFLVSARNTWGVYKIDRETGRIVWTLGGKRSTFKLGRGMRFAWQHDARRRPDGTLSLFDNSAPPGPRKRSRALVVGLDETNRTATLLGTREHPRRLRGAIMGNAQTLDNGNVMVGWGSQRYFSEFAADGRLVWDAHLSLGFDTYRAYRANWTGRPHTVPRAAGVKRRGGGMSVYASWNGATEVASWDVLAGPRPDALQQVASSPRRGFETVIGIAARAAYVAVRAKDAAGQALATSPTRRVSG